MKRLLLTFLTASALVACSTDTASANHPFGYGSSPAAFYYPHVLHRGSIVGRAPHFAVNPPVYYGARYARPYGLSPFASPPLLGAPEGYQGRLRTKFEDGPHTTPAPACNPYVSHAPETEQKVVKGEVRLNPYVTEESDQLAKNQ